MDVEKAGHYKLYRCRSLLACDSGGTVYDTSQRFENTGGEALLKNADESANESGQSENIIYIIDKDNKAKLRPSSQQTLAATKFCFEEFDNCRPCPNTNHELKCNKEESPSQDDNFKYYIVHCEDIDSTPNSTLDSDSFDRENFEYYCDSINQTSPAATVEDVSISSSNSKVISENIFIQEQVPFHNLSNLSPKTNKSLNDLDEKGIESSIKHIRKRKQSYKIKSNSFTELIEDDDSCDASLVSENGKKKKMTCNRDEQKNKLQFQKCNPFKNLKMSSILKNCAINQIQLKNCTRESLTSISTTAAATTIITTTSDDENSELSSVSSSEQVLSKKSFSSHFPSTNNFFKYFDTAVRLNADLTNANYLEYLQPREKIVESNMDKLLSPTIEVEYSTAMKHVEINQHVQEAQVDCNGNDINTKGNLNCISNSKISASEAVEKLLVSKAVYAVKLGFQNIFNTSNECVIEDVLFDSCFSCKGVELEINLTANPEPKIPLVLLENIEYLTHHHHHHEQFNNPFKNVSCSLKDTVNEFDNFRGFVEDNSNQDDKINETQLDPVASNNQEINYYNDFHKQCELIQSKPYGSFNSSVEASQVVKANMNDIYDSRKYQVSNTSISERQSIAPLRMRIKRVSDDNQYVIDGSSIFNVQSDNKATSKFQKNPDSKYECFCCLEKFRTKRLLKSHISENHRGPYDLECEICHMKSKKSLAYKKHKPWCEKSTAFKCEICQKVYCYRAVLLRHLNTHKYES